jgi:adiponectin receptor
MLGVLCPGLVMRANTVIIGR